MILLIDIGNTCIKWQIADDNNAFSDQFYGSAIIEHSNFNAKDYWGQIAQACQQQLTSIKQIAISCVKPSFTKKLLAQQPDWYSQSVYIAESGTSFNRLVNAYSEPSQMGVDRWLAMIAATRGGAQGALVIDLGTAITVDWVNNTGAHLGGYIIAGIKNQLNALLSNTEKVIASEELAIFDRGLGQNTQDCVTHGVIASICDFLTLQAKQAEQQGIDQLVLTGGDASKLFPLLNQALKDSKIQVMLQPKLIFEGLLTSLLKDRKKT